MKPFRLEKINIAHPSIVDEIVLHNQGIRHLKVKVLAGNVCVEGTHDSVARLSSLWPEGFTPPAFYQKDDTLYLMANDWKIFTSQKHAFALNLTVPSTLSVEVLMKAGVISVDGIQGDMHLGITIGGSIEARTAARYVDAYVGAGDLRLFGVCPGRLKAGTLLGDVEIEYDQVETGADIMMSSKLGDVKAIFPAGFAPVKQGKTIDNKQGAFCKASTFLGDINVTERGTTS